MPIVLACKKENRDYCWECRVLIQDPNSYIDVGCMTDAEWATYEVVDSQGNGFPASEKPARCRKK